MRGRISLFRLLRLRPTEVGVYMLELCADECRDSATFCLSDVI